MIGHKINNYVIESLLGEGGMGNVYLAKHESMDRLVAIKAILPELFTNEEVRKRFLNEAATMAKLQHTNIVGMYDYVSNDDGLFLIMEFVDGEPLSSYLDKMGGAVEEDLAIEITKQVVSACSHAHQNGIIHRDIKPANIMVTNEGVVKILDFGIAKMMSEEVNKLTKTGTQLGTVHYMSPEQVKGETVTPATDMYAIGVTLFQMITGAKPYSNLTTEYQIYDKIVKEDLPDPRTINSSLTEFIHKVVRKATRKDPSERFADCEQFLKVLNDKSGYMAKTQVEQPKPAVTEQTRVQAVTEKTVIQTPPVQQEAKSGWLGFTSIGLAFLLFVFVVDYVMYPWMLNVSVYGTAAAFVIILGLVAITLGIIGVVKDQKMIGKGSGIGGIVFAFLAIVFLAFVDYGDLSIYDDLDEFGEYYDSGEMGYYEWTTEDLIQANLYAEEYLYFYVDTTAVLVLDGYEECFVNYMQANYTDWSSIPEDAKQAKAQDCLQRYN